jgi:methylthioribose-1-phosphate isomerase
MQVYKKDLPTMIWQDRELHLLDQRLLPDRVDYRICRSLMEVADSIRDLTVRGAPAIGISAAYGMVIAAQRALEVGSDAKIIHLDLKAAAEKLQLTRPTAVNLAWALEQANKWLSEHLNATPEEIVKGLEEVAINIHNEDIENNRQMGLNGEVLIPGKASILTHCNAGALATGGYGTALGLIRAAVEAGKDIHVYIDETRPLLQGARITAFELHHEGISATLITDNCAGYLMSQGKIDLIVVGADRIAINGDTANKIGTYSLAVLAEYHKVPFYVAAPISTIDPAITDGKAIVIEERKPDEVTHLCGKRTAPEGISVYNPAFDVTPANLISAIITEREVIHYPDRFKLQKLFS